MKRLVSVVAAAVALGLRQEVARRKLTVRSTDDAYVRAQTVGRSDTAAPLLNQFLQRSVAGSIHVNPRYGVWDPAGHQVLPPGFRPEPEHAASTSTTGG